MSVLTSLNGVWQHVQRPEPELAGQTPAALLARSAQLPGNLRFGSIDGNEVVLLGELRGDEGGLSLDTASHSGQEESIEAGLEASGFTWKRRDSVWVVPVSGRLPREIQITPLADVVRVEASLTGWDDIGEVEALALGRLLCRAQFGLRLARCELDERQARIVAHVASASVERDLPDSLAGVVAGSRLLAREVGVLLSPAMARTYLDFLNRASGVVINGGSERTHLKV